MFNTWAIWGGMALAALLTFGSGVGITAMAAEPYDNTLCGASTITTVSASSELTVLVIDNKGIARSNTDKKAFDNSTYHCASVLRIRGNDRDGVGYCKFMDPDGDFFVGEQVFRPGDPQWKFLEGTGKWKGITGGGTFVPVTTGKPIEPGTAQGCVRATGTYELSK
jgi:hypothetical protein